MSCHQSRHMRVQILGNLPARAPQWEKRTSSPQRSSWGPLFFFFLISFSFFWFSALGCTVTMEIGIWIVTIFIGKIKTTGKRRRKLREIARTVPRNVQRRHGWFRTKFTDKLFLVFVVLLVVLRMFDFQQQAKFFGYEQQP